jgi:hypothetical protein
MVNSLDLLIFAIFLISFVLIQTLGFMKKGWNEALRLGVSKEDLKKTVKNSIGISILPSIPIVITAFVMITCLGVPLSWLRTTLIGSEGMELLCATMVAESVGVQFSPAGMNTTAYVNGAWVMTIGASICLLYAIIFVKPICSKIDKIRNKDAKWVTIFSLCAIVAIMSESVVSNSKKGPIQFICVISCFIFSYLFNVISKKEKLGWVQEFAFPVTLILGLIVGGIATPFFQ